MCKNTSMSKHNGEKLKILYLKDFLLSMTDENHPATVEDMIAFLLEKNIVSEKKSIYRDLNILGKVKNVDFSTEDYGLDIVQKKGDYFVPLKDHPLNLQELKLLIEMVESSASIPEAEAAAIIEKLKRFTSVYEGRKLDRYIGVRNPADAVNTEFRLNSDLIFQAIREKKAISFRYFRYVLEGNEKRRQLREKNYCVSPMSLVWVDQNYYMMAYDHYAGDDSRIRNYRVDRMTSVELSDESYRGEENYYSLIGGDLSAYLNKIFHMFGGESRMVRMRFRDFLMDSVIDRFGMNVIMRKDGPEHFIVTAEVIISSQFYGWLAAFGEDAELLSPRNERVRMKQHLLRAAALYEKEGNNICEETK